VGASWQELAHTSDRADRGERRVWSPVELVNGDTSA
jgi:hypothetical protein